ncbi:MAG: LytTR family transcriptional regulator DNA-binding domain-containing protein [Crocinitomicaceae bacterium]|nr:LytTR family transcriptional regulator DNA-binding domain-containing protein [Crocinitomicaceae bacterium]
MKDYILVIIFFVPYFLFGQEVKFEVFNENSGLPSTQVYDIYQDENGYLWFASDRGIARYDGYNFESFGLKDGVPANTVFKFYPQENGNVWCSTFNNRFFYFNTTDYNFTPYRFNDTLVKYALDAVVNDLQVLENGEIHISYIRPFSQLRIDDSGKVLEKRVSDLFDHQAVIERSKNGEIFNYYLDPSDELIARSEGGEICSTQKIIGSSFKSLQIGKYSVFSDVKQVYIKLGDRLVGSIDNGLSPLNIGKYDDTHFWIGYRDGGLEVVDLDGNITETYLSEESITFLLKDHENGIWISTLSSGVFYCKRPEVRIHLWENEKYVYNLARDVHDSLWVSLYSGSNYSYKNGRYKMRYTSRDKQPTPIDFDQKNSKLAIHTNGTLFMNHQLFSRLDTLAYSMSFSEDKLLFTTLVGWAVNNQSSIAFYDSKQRIKDVVFAPNGFYLATHRGLIFYDTVSHRQTAIGGTSLKCRIEDIEKVKDRYLFGTLGSGLVVKDRDSFESILKEKGLYSNNVNKLYTENDSTVWVCTSMGLNRIEFHANGEFSVSGLSKSDGLIYNNITDVEVIGDTVWVGTRSGLCSFPKHLMNKTQYQKDIEYYLRFIGFEVKDKETLSRKLTALTYDQNKLTFRFKAISFRNSSNLVYRYRIPQLENEWNYTSELHCTYASIPFGDYQLQVQVSSDKEKWSPEITQEFSIAPPFYRTWWFLILIMLLGLGAIYLFFKLRVLVYNRDVTRELIRLLIQKLKRKEKLILFREQGKDVKLKSSEVLYVKSSNNYIEIFTKDKTHVVRFKISEFLSMTPDPLEYLRIHRSYIIRIDKVNSKSGKNIEINDVNIPVGKSYTEQLDKIHF